MSIEQRLLDNGYEGVGYFENPSYDDAILGVTLDGERVVYDYDKMVDWCIEHEGMEEEEAEDFVSYNMSFTYGHSSPVIVVPLY